MSVGHFGFQSEPGKKGGIEKIDYINDTAAGMIKKWYDKIHLYAIEGGIEEYTGLEHSRLQTVLWTICINKSDFRSWKRVTYWFTLIYFLSISIFVFNLIAPDLLIFWKISLYWIYTQMFPLIAINIF